MKKVRIFKTKTGRHLTFEFIEDHPSVGLWTGKCKENEAYAFINDDGTEMCWEDDSKVAIRIYEVDPYKSSRAAGYGYEMWGGEMRDMLPHGARYYL